MPSPRTRRFLIVAAAVALTACAPAMRRAERVVPLQLSFASPEWTGGAIPTGAQCRVQGGIKGSPPLTVDGVPPGATHILVAFNDLSYPPLSTGGGHGTIRVPVPAGSARVVVPSVPSESTSLPAGVAMEAPHRGDVPGAQRGAYLAPCSGGRGNIYEAQVLAVTRTGPPDAPTTIVGEGKITIGRY
jgi:hypothetical protein